MWLTIQTFWSGLSPPMQAALIGAIATVVTATLGASLVVWQIGRQANNAITQNRHNEVLKLKLKIYEEIVDTCRDASNAETDISSYVRLFQANIAVCRNLSVGGLPWSIPNERIPILIEKYFTSRTKAIGIVGLTERWQIVDPRIEIFRTAVNVAIHDIDAAWHPYFNTVLPIMPMEIRGHPQPGTLLPWNPPNDRTVTRIEKLGNELISALSTLGSYIYDFQIEMQNLLLGEFFGRKLEPRKPIDPTLIVVQLDRYGELAHFEKETPWGKHKERVEDEVRASLSGNQRSDK